MMPARVLGLLGFASLIACGSAQSSNRSPEARPGGEGSVEVAIAPRQVDVPVIHRAAIATREDRPRNTILINSDREPKCKEYRGEGCYWMENTSGNYCWVPASWGPDKRSCFALDSCDGGLGQSGGGCYKWAQSSSGPRAPW